MKSITNPTQKLCDEITKWRHDFHRHPEILYDVQRTATIVAEKLHSFGCDEVVSGIGKTGVVGIIKGRQTASNKVVGLRADMDALPITELNTFDHRSTIAGKMHGCGHDGHTAMLLGTAKILCDTRNFNGVAALIFQPAEEGGAGGYAMVQDGMMERFAIKQVFGMHNMPGLPLGQFAIRSGTIMAAADFFDIEIEGVGGHAARPHLCVDPIVAGAHLITAIQTLASRVADPIDNVVISICEFHAGETYNVIPETALLRGTARFLLEATRDKIEAQLAQMCDTLGAAFGARAKLIYKRLYPRTVNDPTATAFAAAVAAKVVDADNVDADIPPMMGGEDFSFMLQVRPGSMILLGNGDTYGLHHPRYDFNDDAIAYGCAYWIKLIETAMPLATS